MYWLDASVDETALETLERLFGITEYPTLVLGEEVYAGFIGYDEFSETLTSWAKDNNAILDELTEEEELISKQGLDFIFSQEGIFRA